MADVLFPITLVAFGLLTLIVTFVTATYCLWRICEWLTSPRRPPTARGFDVIISPPPPDDPRTNAPQ